ncbi:TPA: hypothetical protein SLO96_002973 [Proteus mirabilis]|nr:hypothetical protein [Proteus mirabilis]
MARKPRSYNELGAYIGLSGLHLIAFAEVVGASSASELVENKEDYAKGFNTGMGLVFFNEAKAFLRKRRKLVKEVFSEMYEEHMDENYLICPMQLVLDGLNDGLGRKDWFKAHEVMETLCGGRNVDPDESGQIAWWLYGLWYWYVSDRLTTYCDWE